MWYVQFQTVREFEVPINPVEPVFYETPPGGNFWGGFHCRECAIDCASFGKLPEQAFLAEHGTDDEKFGAFLSVQ